MSFQKLVLDNIEVIGCSHQNNFFGEKSFHYSTTKNLSIRGYVLDLTNSIGVKNIFTNVEEIKNIAQNFQNIIINGINFGVGKFTSLSFDQGNWVKSTQFEANIEIYQTVSLQNLVSKEFTASNYIVTNISSNANPNLLIYKFYKTSRIINGRPLYIDTTKEYILWYPSPLNQWIISINDGSTNNRYQISPSSSSLTAPVGTYIFPGVGSFAGSITLSYDSLDPTDINLSNKRLDLIKSFSETFDLDFDNNTKILGGTHSIEIQYNADNKDLNVIALAQSLATELLNKSIPINLSEYNYTTRQEGSYKVLRTESYDVINGRCGFTKVFSYSIENNLKPYSINRNLNIQVANDGIATVQETCNIKAENDIPSLYENALIGLNEQISNSYSLCTGFFSSYKNKFNIIQPLNTNILEKNIKINKFNGIINYEVTFNNDPKTSGNYSFDYTSTLDRSDIFIWNVMEQGTIQGIGEKRFLGNSTIQYSSAESGWSTIKTGIESRLNLFWSGETKDKASTGINLVNKQITRSPYEGSIKYKYVYTDDPSIRNDLGNIKKINIDIEDNGSSGINLKPIFKEYIIPNNTYTLVQNRGLKEQGQFTLVAKADIALDNQDDIFNGLSYLDTIKTELRKFYGGGLNDKYLQESEFGSDEIEQNITYKEIYKYS